MSACTRIALQGLPPLRIGPRGTIIVLGRAKPPAPPPPLPAASVQLGAAHYTRGLCRLSHSRGKGAQGRATGRVQPPGASTDSFGESTPSFVGQMRCIRCSTCSSADARFDWCWCRMPRLLLVLYLGDDTVWQPSRTPPPCPRAFEKDAACVHLISGDEIRDREARASDRARSTPRVPIGAFSSRSRFWPASRERGQRGERSLWPMCCSSAC